MTDLGPQKTSAPQKKSDKKLLGGTWFSFDAPRYRIRIGIILYCFLPH